ncbi:MAG: glycosyltransferase family 2 protein [Candidatus Taylorbacteria bacterium]|nr:glycosyltransferase family 2 protein [Candidatus Taylorbacteria bacterium]
MPAYNAGGTVAESVESIMNGNFGTGDELIVVDDGSTDDTLLILEELRKKYPFIEIIVSKENRGCPAARNIAYAAAKNPIIFNLYADDVLAPASVPKLKTCMIAEKADMAGFAEYRYFREEKNGKKKITHKWLCRPGVLTFADFLAGDINPGPGGNYMFTKALWQTVGGVWEYGKGLHEAWGFTLKCLAAGAKFAVMPNSFYYHRYGTDSLFTREAKKENEVSLMATKMIMPYLDLLDPRDALYIKSEAGSKSWYNTLDRSPIRLKNTPVGKTGALTVPFREKLKRISVRFARKHPKILALILSKN